MSHQSDKLIDPLARRIGERTVAWMLVWFIGMSVATVLGSYVLWDNQSDQADRTTALAFSNAQTSHDLVRAVCALRGDLEQRITGTQLYLATHPGDVFGIPRASIVQTMQGQQRTVKALRFVDCPDG